MGSSSTKDERVEERIEEFWINISIISSSVNNCLPSALIDVISNYVSTPEFIANVMLEKAAKDDELKSLTDFVKKLIDSGYIHLWKCIEHLHGNRLNEFIG